MCLQKHLKWCPSLLMHGHQAQATQYKSNYFHLFWCALFCLDQNLHREHSLHHSSKDFLSEVQTPSTISIGMCSHQSIPNRLYLSWIWRLPHLRLWNIHCQQQASPYFLKFSTYSFPKAWWTIECKEQVLISKTINQKNLSLRDHLTYIGNVWVHAIGNTHFAHGNKQQTSVLHEGKVPSTQGEVADFRYF